MKASYYEIYCGKVLDLLNSKKICHVWESGTGDINLVNLKKKKVQNI